MVALFWDSSDLFYFITFAVWLWCDFNKSMVFYWDFITMEILYLWFYLLLTPNTILSHYKLPFWFYLIDVVCSWLRPGLCQTMSHNRIWLMLSALGKDQDYCRQCHAIVVFLDVPMYWAKWLIEFYWLTVQLGGYMSGICWLSDNCFITYRSGLELAPLPYLLCLACLGLCWP